jgi:UPF0042 nucleotide-binding protein
MPVKPSILIISGLSGSGKTVALRAVEDIDLFCVDNLPPQLIDSFVSTVTEKDRKASIAIGIDIREKEFLHVLTATLPSLQKKYSIEILFLEAEQDILVRRFKETRRPHPLITSEAKEIEEAISLEKGLLLPLRDIADRIIDTSPFTPHQLRQHIISIYSKEKSSYELDVTLMSFGFKYGVPQNVDLLFDVRFLPNPHFVPELKELNGTDAPVKEYVLEKPQTGEFIEKIAELLGFLIPNYKKEGKAYLIIGIGCTGGRHRSIAIAEELSSRIKHDNVGITVLHRDL